MNLNISNSSNKGQLKCTSRLIHAFHKAWPVDKNVFFRQGFPHSTPGCANRTV
jgi:hypothetical protein